MISDDIIDKVRLSSDILSVIREYVPDLKRAGRNWKACCPFHNEKTPSFTVSPEKGIFRCFGCSAAGDVFKFIMLIDNVSWIEAVKKLAAKANIEIKESGRDAVKVSEKTKLFEILESSAIFYHRHLLENQLANHARAYLQKRGINLDTVKKFKLGFAPKGALLNSALKKGALREDLLKAGLITKTERESFFEYMSERLVFPIFDVQGRVVAFGGRTLSQQNPKYLNTPETSVYSKSSNLYGLFQTLAELRKERRIIVLEGYVDVVVPWQFGITGAVASLGTAFTANHAKIIARYADKVKLLYDSDDAGRTATQRALEILVESGIETTVSVLPENVDADEFLVANGKEEFLKLLDKTSKSAIDFMIERASGLIDANSSQSKEKAVSFLLDFISRSSSEVVQNEWIREISGKIGGLNDSVVRREIRRRRMSSSARSRVSDERQKGLILNNKKIGLSLEENLLHIMLTDRSFVKKAASECFTDPKCAKVHGMLVSGFSDADILNSLSQDDNNWFGALTFEDIKYSDIQESFNTILRDIETKKLENKRRQLQQEYILMTEGKIARDDDKIKKYKELTSLLKGSGK
ncbi:MAG: DNA primase [Endomicrobium sp.]|jgi:DNA primase|nr:DNA primase [Endomicrobium sp.]